MAKEKVTKPCPERHPDGQTGCVLRVGHRGKHQDHHGDRWETGAEMDEIEELIEKDFPGLGRAR